MRRFSKGSVPVKSPSEPPSSAAAGGAFRRSCLSPRSGRVLRRPSDASSAGESADQAQLEQATGEAGSPFLPTSLATQRSRAPAGARPGQCDAKQRKAAGLHQRTANPARGCPTYITSVTRAHPLEAGINASVMGAHPSVEHAHAVVRRADR